MRCGIIIINYNLGETVNKQLNCLRRFSPETERIVIDNGDNKEISETVRAWTNQHRGTYIKSACKDLDPSLNHAFALNLGWHHFKDSFDILWFCDHDLFLLKDLDLEKYMEGKAFAGIPQYRDGMKYFWPGCLIMNLHEFDKNDVDFYPCERNGTRLDTGGALFDKINGMDESKMIDFSEVHTHNPYCQNHEYNFYSIINDGMFMHYINGSNWAGTEEHTERLSTLNVCLDSYIQ